MTPIDGCTFDTERLIVAPWHDGSGDGALADFVIALLTPAVTVTLPTEWGGSYDRDRAERWVSERDAESVVLGVRDRASGSLLGVLILSPEAPASPARR